MQLFQLNRQVLLGSLLSVSFQSVPWIDWGDDNPSAEYLAQVQRDLIQSQERQFDGQTCTLSNGNILNAPEFVCANLDRTKAREKPNQAIPEEIAHFSCPPLPPLEHGNVFCWDEFRAGTVCIGVCENGWTIDPNKKKKCLKRKTWQKTRPGKSPVKWNLGKSNFKCIRDYLESPCLTNNGGCSDDCIDRGDGIAVCVCPCGKTLDFDKKTCVQTNVCPFDVSFWMDGTSNACDSFSFQTKQKENMADMVDFFRREVRSFDARITAGVYSDGKIAKEISNWDSTNVDSIIADINTFSAPCGEPKIQDAFHHFENERSENASTVTFVSMGGELGDSNADIFAGRPKDVDHLIVLAHQQSTSQKYLEQTSLIACGHTFHESCDNIVMMDGGVDAAAIESRISRTRCFDRTFAASISCSEFAMELQIPSCALRGLNMDDIIFNSGMEGDCGAVKNDNGTFFNWKISYNDCGTIRNVDEDGTVSYTNRLKTKVDEGLAVFPILPVFDVPLQCDLHTQFEFVFEGDYYPKLTSFQADIQVAGQQLTGNLSVFADDGFSQKFEDKEIIETGIPLFVQTEVQAVNDKTIQLISCVTSADDLSNMTAVNAGQIWPLIEDGCLTDWTVSMLPRGPNKEVRFTFESFRFQDSKDGEPVNIQCSYRPCLEEDNCASVQECTNQSARRKRRAPRTRVKPGSQRMALSLA